MLQSRSLSLLDYVADFVSRRGGQLRILEIGAGTGSLAIATLGRLPRAEFIVSDAARGMLELARDRIAAAGVGEGRVQFVEGAADALPVAGGSVDLIMSSFVLQLVPDRLAALREAYRLLAPGGIVAYLTWLDRDSRLPFLPAEEFDEAVFDLQIEEPELAEEPHAGDVRSGRSAGNELRRAGFVNASAREDELVYDWTPESYLEYKLAYDERFLLNVLDDRQQRELEANTRSRLARLSAADFRWHAPVVYARGFRPASP